MAENKTKETKGSVTEFLKKVSSSERRSDTRAVMKMLRQITGKSARMWGASIVGYDKYRYKYESGRGGEFPMIAVSPRAQNLSIYIMPGFDGCDALLKKLGKHKIGKSCLYIKRLSDVDTDVLLKLMERSYKKMQKKYAKP